MSEHFFITGAMGCIGAWVVKNLAEADVATTVYDWSENKHRLELIMSEDDLAKVNFVKGDITQTEMVKDAVTGSGATHLIHLAAFQVPFCKANPPLGAAVNVVGTINMFEAAKEAGIGQMVYASSLAVYGRREDYPGRLLTHDSPLDPLNHYGVFKQANEGNARIYWQDDGIASVGLRPYTLYGPGRDQGMTSTPTKAMLAAAQGEAYEISFGGSCGFQYTDDIAKLFIRAARTSIKGAEVFNVQGAVAHMDEIVAAIEAAEPTAKGRISYVDGALPFPDGQEDGPLRELMGDIPDTPLAEGVAKTIAHFKAALAAGWEPGAEN